MKVDFKKVMKSIDGKDMKEKFEDGKIIPLTYESVVIKGLYLQDESDRSSSEKDIADRYDLIMRIKKAKAKDKVEINLDEIQLIKRQVHKLHNTHFYGKINELLKV
jgi:hypothetical protein